MQGERYYKTTDFYLACYLFSKKFELANVNKTNPRKAVFVFINSPEVMDEADNWQLGRECLVDGRKLYLAIKTLKSKLYDEEF